MKAFEIHTFQNGKWMIDSVFNDRDLALFEVQRMDLGRRYSGVRLIEETFDEETQESSIRTIFRGKRDAQTNPSSKSKTNGRPLVGKTVQGNGKKPERAIPKKRERKKEQQKKSGLGFLTLILLLCIFGGFAALIVLRILANGI
jgi:hypothetical protein